MSKVSWGGESWFSAAIDYSLLCGFCSKEFPLPLGALDGLRYFIVALPRPLPYNHCVSPGITHVPIVQNTLAISVFNPLVTSGLSHPY